MQFLVSICADRWSDLDEAQQAEVGAQEAARGAKLLRDGVIERIWRLPGTRNNVGIWNCRDADELHHAISSLPAWPWLTASAQLLAQHPLTLVPPGKSTGLYASDSSDGEAHARQEDIGLKEDIQHCVLYYLKEGAEAEYDRYHETVWPEVQAKIRAQGTYDYSIFRRGTLVISVFRSRGLCEEEMRKIEVEVNDRWSTLMSDLLVAVTDENNEPFLAHRIFRLA